MESQSNGHPFAVVAFIEEDANGEEVVSEIPANWLLGYDRCYWPSTKNINNLISKCVEPDPEKWKIFCVEVKCFCASLEQARKKAELCSSSDETQKGKGMRRKKKTLKTIREDQTHDSSEEDDIDLLDIPKFPKNKDKNCTPQSKDIESTSLDCIDLESLPIIISQEIDKVPPDHRIINSGAIEFGELKDLICEKFTQVLNVISNVSLHINDINRRLDKMERENKKSSNISYEDIEGLTKFLPIKTIEEMESFEELVSTNSNRSNLLKYLANIGGTNTKDNIIRLLKKVFSNSFAVNCSWLGQRNNFKVCNLRTMEIIKGAVSDNFPHSEKEFENVTSEWFRQAKQRLVRENNKNLVFSNK